MGLLSEVAAHVMPEALATEGMSFASMIRSASAKEALENRTIPKSSRLLLLYCVGCKLIVTAQWLC